MKGQDVLLGQVNGREAAALVSDGVLDDFLIDSDAPRLGTIYRAKVDRVIKGQNSAFLTAPDANLFMRQAKGLVPGDTLLVQVAGQAEPGKATPVTPRLLFKSRYAMVTPDAPGMNISRSIRDEEQRVAIRDAAETKAALDTEYGIVLRSACDGADPDAIAEDVDAMLECASAVLADAGTAPEKLLEGDGPHMRAWRDWPSAIPRNDDLSDCIAEASTTRIALGSHGHMFVEPTRACVTVDINTGADTSPAAGLKANMAAMRALPRALRVRGLGGQIVIDPAPMPKKDRKSTDAALRAALRADQVETSIVGWTAMGHVELNRKRDRVPIAELLR
jgi:Ribonuclease G/E